MVLSDRALEGLRTYKYSSGGYTWLDNLHEPFWNKAVSCMPLWLAPNLITLTGFLGVVITYFLNVYYNPTFTEDCPPWVHILTAAAMVVYINLDCMDGKQARRTQSSSPLGQLFDHGCDAFVTHAATTNVASAIREQLGVRYTLAMSAALTIWVLAQWVEYHTGHMMYGNAYYGIMEATYSLAGLSLLTGFLGSDFWHQPLPLGKDSPVVQWTDRLVGPGHTLDYADVVLGLVILSCSFQSLDQLRVVFLTSQPERQPAEYRGNKTLGRPAAALHLLYIATLLGLGAAYYLMGVTNGLDIRCASMSYGVGFALVATQLIMGHMCKEPFQPSPVVYGLMGGVLLARYYASYRNFALLLYGSTGMLVLYYLYYVTAVIQQVCAHLKIHIFTIPPPKTE